jgi:signal peptidase I
MDADGEEPVRRPARRWRTWAEVFGATVLLALALRLFVLDAYRIPSASMAETLLPGDFLLVSKLVYGAATPRTIPFTSISLPFFRLPGFGAPQRGDIVVFVLDGTTYVKRCIALPGDTALVHGDTVFVNGMEVPLPPTARTLEGRSVLAHRSLGPLVVPRRGDIVRPQRQSMAFLLRLIEREGHAVFPASGGRLVIDGEPADAYTVEEDQYFMVGDNRENSLDSRVNGFVPRSGLVGKAMLVYWSVAPHGGEAQPAGVRWTRLGTVVR